MSSYVTRCLSLRVLPAWGAMILNGFSMCRATSKSCTRSSRMFRGAPLTEIRTPSRATWQMPTGVVPWGSWASKESTMTNGWMELKPWSLKSTRAATRFSSGQGPVAQSRLSQMTLSSLLQITYSMNKRLTSLIVIFGAYSNNKLKMPFTSASKAPRATASKHGGGFTRHAIPVMLVRQRRYGLRW